MNEPTPLPGRLIDIHKHVPRDDPGGSKLVELLDALSVEQAVVMGTPLNPNDQMLRAVQQHPGRLVGGAYLDPRQGQEAIEELGKYHAEGIRIVKLFPNLGYYPDDDAYGAFFDDVAEAGMAVLSHCGWLMPAMGVTAAYYSHPGRFEKLVRTYTDTPFIFAHMGGIAGFLEAIMLTTRTPNAYVDCSPGQGVWVLEAGGKLAASIPPERLMWGLDSCPSDEWLPRQRRALEELGFAEHFEKIFYSNARRLLESIGAI